MIAHELLAHYKKIDGKIDEARSSCKVVIDDTNNPETAIVDRCRALISTLPEVVAVTEAKTESAAVEAVPAAATETSPVEPATEEKK